MKLIFDIPVDFVTQLLSEWLTLRNICKLEEAMCTADNRLRMGCIYEALVISCSFAAGNVKIMEEQLDWFVLRRIRVGNFRVFQPLSRSALPKLIALLKHSNTHLRKLHLQQNDSSLNTVVACISHYCPEVQVLEMEEMMLSAPFFAMISNLQNLKELTLLGYEGLDIEYLNGISCTSVRKLSLPGNYSAQVQQSLLNMCPNLVQYTVFAEDAILQDMPICLESLVVEGCDTVRVINLNANLKKINIVCFDTNDEGVANIFTCCPHIEELAFKYSCELTEATLLRIADTYSRTLKLLDITGWYNLSSSSVKYICQKCTSLTSLALGNNSERLNPICIIAALDNCPTLRALDIGQSAVTDEVMTRIAAAPLECIRMRGVKGITEKGLMALVSGCAALKKIAINHDLFNPLVQLMWQKMRPDLKFLQ